MEYVTLQPWHLDQVHDLLARAFWAGIDGESFFIIRYTHKVTLVSVSDSLMYSPERCTVIATYKKVVVGVAFLSSPPGDVYQLSRRTGRLGQRPNSNVSNLSPSSRSTHNSGFRSMLYHLITLNPRRDITLHVSINNPAVVRNTPQLMLSKITNHRASRASAPV